MHGKVVPIAIEQAGAIVPAPRMAVGPLTAACSQTTTADPLWGRVGKNGAAGED